MKPLFSIYDSVAEIYTPVFQAENEQHAIRMFQQSIDLKHKTDFALWRIGYFDADNGELKEKSPACVMHGKNIPSNKETQQ